MSPPSSVVDVEQAEARRRPGGPSMPSRIGDGVAEHLVAAAEAEHACRRARRMGQDVDVPALRAQRGEIGDGRLGAGQDDEIGVGRDRLARRDEAPDRRPAPAAADRDRRNWRCAAARGTTMRRCLPCACAARRASSAKRVLGRQPRCASRKCGTRPSDGQPVRSAMSACRRRTALESPRNLLTMKPAIIAASSGSSTAAVPTRLAMTPPRSMSPTSTTGTSAARAKPILAMSSARRLISAGEPAPSTSTMIACVAQACRNSPARPAAARGLRD